MAPDFTALATKILDGLSHASAPTVSPDGATVAFVVTRLDLDGNKYRRQVWTMRSDGSTPPRPVTAGDPGEGSPTWSPDSRSLAFVSARAEKKGEATLHVLPLEGGEVRTLVTMPDGVSAPAWSPDGSRIAFISRTQDERYKAETESAQAPRKIETFFTRIDGDGWTFDRPAHVYVVDADGLSPARNCTPGPFEHSGVAWLPDSTAVITTAQRHDGWDRDLASDLYVVSTDGEAEPCALTNHTGNYGSASVSPDGSTVAFIGSDDALLYPQNTKVGIVPILGGTHTWISSGLDRTFSPTTGSVAPTWLDNKTVLASAEDRGTVNLYQLDTNGSSPVRFDSQDGWISSWSVVGATVAVAVGHIDRPDEIVVTVDGEVTATTNIASRYLSTTSAVGWEHATTQSADGTVDIDYWIARPPDFDPGQRYPVLLNVHGGPFTQYGNHHHDEVQLQAAAGYIVVLGNPRGSSGRDSAWGHSILGPKHPAVPGLGWGTVDVDDVLSILDAALAAEPAADADRVGMLGGSYGGFMATWLAGKHSDRFQAICSERSVNNLLAEEWNSDIATAFRVEHGPDPVEDPDEYLRMSPIQFAADIDVPMLLIHSENDIRCPINQAEELFVTLRLLDKPVTFYRFPGECHELSRSGSPIHRRQRAEIILEFFGEHLSPAGASQS